MQSQRQIDINRMSQVQLREPPKIVSDFLKDDVKEKSKRWSVFTENDKKELVLFLL